MQNTSKAISIKLFTIEIFVRVLDAMINFLQGDGKQYLVE